MFSMAGSKQHSARKRLISNVYSKSYLQSSPDYQKLSHTIVVDRLFPLLEDHAVRKEPLNVLELNYTTAMDFITSYQFGISGGSNFLQDIKFRKYFLDLYYSRKSFTFWPQEMPKMRRFLHSIGIRVTPRFVDVANDQIEDWCLKLCSAAKAYTSSEKSTTPIVFQQLQQNLARTDEKGNLSDNRFVASEMLDHLAAGQETTGITLTYLEHEMSKKPELQRRLREELLTLNTPVTYDPKKQDGGLSELPSPKALDTLPLLHAIIMETLRRHAPIPGPQPRKTPNTPCTIAGYNNIPPGTRIAAAAYTLHRNADVFPEPELWKPERWLDVSEEQKTEMGRWFWAFGSGGRMCIGSNFAMQGRRTPCEVGYARYAADLTLNQR
jgi:cytochrome P450